MNPRIEKGLTFRKGINREILGSFHPNPFLNTQDYEVGLSNGSYHELTANQIEKTMFSQIDYKGYKFQIFSKITDHKSNENKISISDVFIK